MYAVYAKSMMMMMMMMVVVMMMLMMLMMMMMMMESFDVMMSYLRSKRFLGVDS
jgi:hypothetical protein